MMEVSIPPMSSVTFMLGRALREKWQFLTTHSRMRLLRGNKAIVGAAKAMLHDQGLPLFLWVEAWNTLVYMQNRNPHRVLGDKTPEEAFSGKKPEVRHFRIFGCLTYSHVPSEKRTKLNPTAEKGVFVGYSETSKAFRIYIPSLRKTVVRQDVRFEEDRAFQRS
jgi:hypothetical protein